MMSSVACSFSLKRLLGPPWRIKHIGSPRFRYLSRLVIKSSFLLVGILLRINERQRGKLLLKSPVKEARELALNSGVPETAFSQPKAADLTLERRGAAQPPG